jgi:hypothetical protein
MENNFFEWLTKPIPQEEVEIWMNVNNIILEKLDLFYDFSLSLYYLVKDTYLGEDQKTITKIVLTSQQKKDHFDWCWKKNVEIFSKENLYFNIEGEHYDYFSGFFKDAFYLQDDEKVKNSIEGFFIGLFTNFKNYTKSDLDMITEIYKMLDKNLSNKKLY